jgi:hypothetical protein
MRASQTNSQYIVIRVIGLLLVSLITYILPIFNPRILILWIAYCAIIFSHGIICTYRHKQPTHLLLVPTLFLLEHTGYGLGLIIGLLKGKYTQPTISAKIKLIKHIQ